jgi:hypothetical protein
MIISLFINETPETEWRRRVVPGQHSCATGHNPGEMASEQHEEQQRQHVMKPEIVSW